MGLEKSLLKSQGEGNTQFCSSSEHVCAQLKKAWEQVGGSERSL